MPRNSASCKTNIAHPENPTSEDECLEVLDRSGKTLLIMPRKSVLRHKLRHRMVLVCLRDLEDKIYVHKRARGCATHPGLWNISASGLVLAGEARMDAALRELAKGPGVSGLELTLTVVAEPSVATGNAEISLYRTHPVSALPRPNPATIEEGMFVDRDELRALVRDLPHLLTPALLWTAEQLGVSTATS